MKIRLLVLVGIAILCLFSYAEKKSDTSYLLEEVVRTVKTSHLSPKVIDDDFSAKMFDYYLSLIDPEKQYLTLEDIRQLKEYQYHLDDELEKGTLQFFAESLQYLDQGIDRAHKYCYTWLRTPLDISVDEAFSPNPDLREYAADAAGLKEHWRKLVKKNFVEELWNLENSGPEVSSFAENKAQALQGVERIFEHQFALLKQLDTAERMESYINAFLKIHDPQSEYLSPEQKAAWEAAFTRSLVGVGIQFEIAGNYPVIKELITGSPAWKSNLLAPGDLILKITDQTNSPVELAGATREEVAELLQGEKGTALTIWVRKAGGAVNKVPLTRDELTLDLAMGFTLATQGVGNKVGYIKLPRFYGGEAGCAAHVLECLNYLKGQNVKGLILDLRNNQGGSAREVIKTMSYFLEQGTVMQAQYQNGDHRVFEDTDSIAVYRQPLIVLVNAGSASGSELLAGTMQDYHRALIVGTTSTYGKGSIQQFFTLNPENENSQPGEIKLTIGKFFTAAGRSPQYHGITPDIILPDEQQYLPSGERVHPFSFIIDDLVPATVVQEVNNIPDLELIRKNSNNRVVKNERFQLINQQALDLKQAYEHPEISLNYKQYKIGQLKRQQLQQSYQGIFSKLEGFTVTAISQAADQIDSTVMEGTNFWRSQIEKDPHVQESFWMMTDLLG